MGSGNSAFEKSVNSEKGTKFYPQWVKENVPDLTGRRIVVTGSNSGLGFHAVRAYLAKGAEVIMACRTVSKAEAAKKLLLQEYPEGNVTIMQLDLSSFKSVNAFADAFLEKYDSLYALVNNAGVMALPFSETEDGNDIQLQTNHLSHFLLTQRLFPLLVKSGTAENPARLVNHASLAHRGYGIKLDNLNLSEASNWDRYSQSKRCNIVFTTELAKRIEEEKVDNVVATCAHPGYSATNLQNGTVFTWTNRVMAQSGEDGALPLIQATVGKTENGAYHGPSGMSELWGKPKIVSPPYHESLTRPDLMKGLWEASEKICKCKFDVAAK